MLLLPEIPTVQNPGFGRIFKDFRKFHVFVQLFLGVQGCRTAVPRLLTVLIGWFWNVFAHRSRYRLLDPDGPTGTSHPINRDHRNRPKSVEILQIQPKSLDFPKIPKILTSLFGHPARLWGRSGLLTARNGSFLRVCTEEFWYRPLDPDPSASIARSIAVKSRKSSKIHRNHGNLIQDHRIFRKSQNV